MPTYAKLSTGDGFSFAGAPVNHDAVSGWCLHTHQLRYICWVSVLCGLRVCVVVFPVEETRSLPSNQGRCHIISYEMSLKIMVK